MISESQSLTEAMADAQISKSSHPNTSPSAAAAAAATTTTTAVLFPMQSSLPTTMSRSYKLLGISTDAYVQIFQDRIVVGMSQRDMRIGTWCLCQAAQSAVDPTTIDYDISTVLGDRHDAMIGVYGRQIVERILRQRLLPTTASSSMVIFLGLSLLDGGKDPEMFQIVLQVILQLIQDAMEQMKGK